MDKSEQLRQIPQLDFLLAQFAFRRLSDDCGHNIVKDASRRVLAQLREEILRSESKDLELPQIEDLAKRASALIRKERRALQAPLINASGVILHTNLGRAPLGRGTAARVNELVRGYCNLEYDLERGRRGTRYAGVEQLLTKLTGAEAALVVNNNAAAVLLILDTLAKGREVLVSRGELVEIGGAFRVPDVMTQSGAILAEIGTTNKCRVSDYRKAINPQTAAILKVHRSNFKIMGFTEEASLDELALLAKETGLPFVYDLGSGLLHPTPPAELSEEPTVAASMAAKVDLLCFSGDKLLGGPQAGIIVGRKDLVDQLKLNQLTRALRVDKLVLGALQEVLEIYLDEERINEEIPFYRMLSMSCEEIELRADILVDLLSQRDIPARVVPCKGEIGGGSAPGVTIDSIGIEIDPTVRGIKLQEFERRLRLGEPAVIGYIQQERFILDLRTVFEDETETLLRALAAAWTGDEG